MKDKVLSIASTIIAVVLLLFVTALLLFGQISNATKKRAAEKAIEEFNIALKSYYDDCGEFPTWQQGLEALWCKPVLFPVPGKWNGPYLPHQVQCDPWGADYVYTRRDCLSFPRRVPYVFEYAIICFGADSIMGGSGFDEDIMGLGK